jgi:hypothetical protein
MTAAGEDMAMTKISEGKSKHCWVSNRAFTRIYGIKKICLYCRQTNENATKVCPGKKAR